MALFDNDNFYSFRLLTSKTTVHAALVIRCFAIRGLRKKDKTANNKENTFPLLPDFGFHLQIGYSWI
jgi:hypothetical protein